MSDTSAIYGSSDLHVAHAGLMQVGGRMRQRGDALTFWALFVSTFLIFLAVAIVKRALPGAHGAPQGVRRSVFEEAKISASTASAFAFMG